MIAVTRCYRFPAAHVLQRSDLTDEENECLYGKCASYHGHDYGLEVTVTGRLDGRTGRIVAPERLDALVRERVLERLSHRPLNEDAWFEKVLPTAENVVRRVADELSRAIGEETGARLLRVRLRETRNNVFECGGRP